MRPAEELMTALRLALLLIFLDASEAVPCDTFAVNQNQEHFREAVHVFTGTAIDEGHAYKVDRVWRGAELETVVLSLPVGSGCEKSVPSIPEEKYLITIYCERPNESGLFDCERSAERIEGLETRLRFLEHSIPTSPRDVLEQIEDWTSGRKGDAEFARWIDERAELAEVDDWTSKPYGHIWSPTLVVMRAFDDVVNDRGVEAADLSCEFRRLERLAPVLKQVLTSPPVTEPLPEKYEEVIESIGDALDSIEEECE